MDIRAWFNSGDRDSLPEVARYLDSYAKEHGRYEFARMMVECGRLMDTFVDIAGTPGSPEEFRRLVTEAKNFAKGFNVYSFLAGVTLSQEQREALVEFYRTGDGPDLDAARQRSNALISPNRATAWTMVYDKEAVTKDLLEMLKKEGGPLLAPDSGQLLSDHDTGALLEGTYFGQVAAEVGFWVAAADDLVKRGWSAREAGIVLGIDESSLASVTRLVGKPKHKIGYQEMDDIQFKRRVYPRLALRLGYMAFTRRAAKGPEQFFTCLDFRDLEPIFASIESARSFGSEEALVAALENVEEDLRDVLQIYERRWPHLLV